MHTSPSPNAHGQLVTDSRAIEDEIVQEPSTLDDSRQGFVRRHELA